MCGQHVTVTPDPCRGASLEGGAQAPVEAEIQGAQRLGTGMYASDTFEGNANQVTCVGLDQGLASLGRR